MNPTALALTAAAASRYNRLCCDFCHTDTRELRIADTQGWITDPVVCAACYPGPQDDFTALELAQKGESE